MNDLDGLMAGYKDWICSTYIVYAYIIPAISQIETIMILLDDFF